MMISTWECRPRAATLSPFTRLTGNQKIYVNSLNFSLLIPFNKDKKTAREKQNTPACCSPWIDLSVWQHKNSALNGIHFLSILSCEEINYTHVSQKYLWVFKSFFPLSFSRWKYFCLIDQHLPLWDPHPHERCRERVWGLSAHFNLVPAAI